MAAHLRRSWQPKGRAEARSRRRDLRNVCFRRLCYCSPVRDHGGVPWTYNQRARSRVSGAPNRTQGACMFRGGRVSLRFLAGGAKACCRCKRRCWRADRTDPCERKLYPRAESSWLGIDQRRIHSKETEFLSECAPDAASARVSASQASTKNPLVRKVLRRETADSQTFHRPFLPSLLRIVAESSGSLRAS